MGRQNGIRGYETEPKASTTCRGRTGTGSTAGPADRLQAVGGAIVALDGGLGHMSEDVVALLQRIAPAGNGEGEAA